MKVGEVKKCPFYQRTCAPEECMMWVWTKIYDDDIWYSCKNGCISTTTSGYICSKCGEPVDIEDRYKELSFYWKEGYCSLNKPNDV